MAEIEVPPRVSDVTSLAEARAKRAMNSDAEAANRLEFSDDALTIRMVRKHATELRFVAAWNQYYHYAGTHWQHEETLYAFDLARDICRDASREVPKKFRKIAANIASAKTVAAVERLVKADRAIAAVVDQWDRDDWILNTPGGVIDLRSGELRAHSIQDYCTKIAAITPDFTCKATLFQAFLSKITDGNVELQRYLQRVFGYCLTGCTREHVMFDGYGKGRNGKSVLMSTVSGILGSYACSAPIETFTATMQEHHPTELARLNGARLVTSSETEEGRAWAESRIKTLTGGDKIAARFMRADFFEYVPRFKLFVIGNHKPRLRTVDEAIRRRLQLIPFGVVIAQEECDPQLFDKIKPEWPAIAAWMVRGCLDWQRDGLQPPDIVRDCTAEYLETQDGTGTWLEECCKPTERGFANYAELFKSWTAWATERGEAVGSQRQLIDAIEGHGFNKKRDGKARARGFTGLYVIPKATPCEARND